MVLLGLVGTPDISDLVRVNPKSGLTKQPMNNSESESTDYKKENPEVSYNSTDTSYKPIDEKADYFSPSTYTQIPKFEKQNPNDLFKKIFELVYNSQSDDTYSPYLTPAKKDEEFQKTNYLPSLKPKKKKEKELPLAMKLLKLKVDNSITGGARIMDPYQLHFENMVYQTTNTNTSHFNNFDLINSSLGVENFVYNKIVNNTKNATKEKEQKQNKYDVPAQYKKENKNTSEGLKVNYGGDGKVTYLYDQQGEGLITQRPIFSRPDIALGFAYKIKAPFMDIKTIPLK